MHNACACACTLGVGWWGRLVHVWGGKRHCIMPVSAGRPALHAALQFDGAAGQLPIKLASQLSSRVRTGDPVDWVKQDDAGVTAVTAAGRRYRGKAAILAMPPHQTGRVRYSPPMPGIRDQLTQRSPMGAIIKVGRRDYSILFFAFCHSEGCTGLLIPCIEAATELHAWQAPPPPPPHPHAWPTGHVWHACTSLFHAGAGCLQHALVAGQAAVGPGHRQPEDH